MKKQAQQKRTKRRTLVTASPRTKKRAPKTRRKSAPVPSRKSVVHQAPTDNRAHVLLRIASEHGLTIEHHQRVLGRHGAAIFGKFGQPLGPQFYDTLANQIASGLKTYLFLTARADWRHEYVTYRCPLRQIHETLDPAKRHLVPGYYIGNAPDIGTWFEIEDIQPISREEMGRIVVLSSGRPMTSAIFSRTNVFRVGVSNARR